jgi:hypothetical protein
VTAIMDPTQSLSSIRWKHVCMTLIPIHFVSRGRTHLFALLLVGHSDKVGRTRGWAISESKRISFSIFVHVADISSTLSKLLKFKEKK